jgi:hypothetical protein
MGNVFAERHGLGLELTKPQKCNFYRGFLVLNPEYSLSSLALVGHQKKSKNSRHSSLPCHFRMTGPLVNNA